MFSCNKKVYLTLVIGQIMDSPIYEMLIVDMSHNLFWNFQPMKLSLQQAVLNDFLMQHKSLLNPGHWSNYGLSSLGNVNCHHFSKSLEILEQMIICLPLTVLIDVLA